ncbi:MAG: class II glutamine amidotransferase [Deltaproteobacteria bacterium]|nr:class II glutamine amidotransferase [Deltaproteobacteria bacterium]
MSEPITGLTLAQKRKEIHTLLGYASDEGKLEKAYELASRYNIHEPWRAICSYKLAHALLFRSNNETWLPKINGLFEAAASAPFLGPWPALFRLAVMERQDGGQEDKLNKAFLAARNAVVKYRRRLNDQNIGNPVPDLASQSGFKNMLRLAVAFLGPDVAERPEDTIEDVQEPKTWILVGHDPKLAKIVQTKDFILQEIEALSEKDKDTVFFKLSSDQSDPFMRHWRIGRQDWQAVPHYPALRLMAIILAQKTTTVEGLISKLCGGVGAVQRNTFSQNKGRLRKELEALNQGQVENIIVSGRGQFPKINPDIKIYGAIEKSVLWNHPLFVSSSCHFNALSFSPKYFEKEEAIMCELLGISCNNKVRATFSFKLLTSHSTSNPNGWGLAFYPDESAQIFKEPGRADNSRLAEFITNYERVRSNIFISHIRRWNKDTEAYKNSHPFSREWNGKSYVFAHNGSVPNMANRSVSQRPFQPIGTTDSERVFCNLMGLILKHQLNLKEEADLSVLEEYLRHINLSRNAKLNCLLSDGNRLLCYRDARAYKRLFLLQRDSETIAEGQHYEDGELSVQLHLKKAQGEKACIVATELLTRENWRILAPGTLTVFEKGEIVYPTPMELQKAGITRAEVYDSPAWAQNDPDFPNIVGMPERLRAFLGLEIGDKVELAYGEKSLELFVRRSDKRLTNADSDSVADEPKCHVWLPPVVGETLGLEITEVREEKASFKKKFGHVDILSQN